MTESKTDTSTGSQPTIETGTFGAGCFWCVEAVFGQLHGVLTARSGFMGGDPERTSYRDVCSGRTGHAEVVQVTFDPERLAYTTLLDWFWRLHDPTTRDRQGNDIGPQYRSVVFTHSVEQEALAQAAKSAADASCQFDAPIVTEISQAGLFHPAEEEHDSYYAQHRNEGYCRMVIAPKLKKLGLED